MKGSNIKKKLEETEKYFSGKRKKYPAFQKIITNEFALTGLKLGY